VALAMAKGSVAGGSGLGLAVAGIAAMAAEFADSRRAVHFAVAGPMAARAASFASVPGAALTGQASALAKPQ